MYRYDDFDRQLVLERTEQFREQVKRRLSGDITEDQFRPLRLMNGVYLQLHAYMLRVAVPYGTLRADQLRQLGYIARRYDKGYGHFTTRQNIQYNWPKLDEIPDALLDLAKVEMHAIQTSGNCIRNTTTDQYAGAAADEIEDPRPYCELIRQWSTFHPEFTYLPRKFKIAVTGSPNDRAAVKVHDIGLRMHQNDAGEVGFEVIVGGGLGRTPFVGKTVRDFIGKNDLFSYLEAILRVYNRFGRRDNKYKARIKILVHEIGVEEMQRLVEEEWAQIKDGSLRVDDAEIAHYIEQFAPPAFETLSDDDAEFERRKAGNREFSNWVRSNVIAHKQPGYAIANVSLKPIGGIPGDATDTQMELVADLSEQYSFGDVRVTHEQNLVLPHVKKADLFSLWAELKNANLATANLGYVTDIISCPGLDYCALATARSIPLSQRISERFSDLDRQHDIGELKIKISGCINACGHHHVGHIGILGLDKRGKEFYQITLGGDASENAEIGKIAGAGFSEAEVVDAIESLVTKYLGIRETGERFIDTYRRVGMDPFKEVLYGDR
ncbi:MULTISPECIES: nitrite/sulfite reductase [Thalassospira]|uniref:nitrite/sulfite reductase n=1 Tax=Thalassospira TaxID=168934 RepID=UPI0008DE6DAD|nr:MULTISPECIES: nitrite/sulfite reductase [Thalassospira]MAB33095.1 sulfite reductase [Thalassospira sp.]MDM7976357.1 nitrite/sulfite reductase [Thalassospira xiamenensis]OHY97664.1 sulfite reductase [Thalassospira sp. MIT1004]HBS22975.1 nitrite/sulfite reductase [Thalassospira sp.]